MGQTGRNISSSSSSNPTSDEVTGSSNSNNSILRALSLLDPVLQFLTRASGHTSVPLKNLHHTIPALATAVPYLELRRLLHIGILTLHIEHTHTHTNTHTHNTKTKHDDHTDTDIDDDADANTNSCWKHVLERQWNNNDHATATTVPVPDNAIATGTDNDTENENETGSRRPTTRVVLFQFHLGFPSGDINTKLCGSTKTAAKRRLAALKRALKEEDAVQKKQKQKQKQKQQTKQQQQQQRLRKQKPKDGNENTNGNINTNEKAAEMMTSIVTTKNTTTDHAKTNTKRSNEG